MSDLKCTVRGYPTEAEARQCQARMEAEAGRPYAVRVSPGAAMGGMVMYEVQALSNCFRGYSVFDDLFGNYEKARSCQKELERMTGARYALAPVREGSLIFSDDYQVTPSPNEALYQGLARYLSQFIRLPLGMLPL